MPTEKQYREQRANVWSEMQNILDTAEGEGRDLSGEERSAFDAAESRFDAITADMRRVQSHASRASEFGAPADSPAETAEVRRDEPTKGYDDVFGRYLRHGVGDLDNTERRTLAAGFDAAANQELRAAGVATGAAGGYFVPQGFRAKVVEAQKAVGSVRSVAETITTETGNTLPWPTADDTGNVGAILAENTQVTEQDFTIGQAQLGAFMYTSKLVRVSLQLLQDSAFSIDTWLPRKLGERIGRIQNTHFTTGVGTTQPEGVQTNAAIGKTGTTGQTLTVVFDDLIDLVHSVDIAYRTSGRARFMMHDLSVAVARKLKGSDGQYIWQPSVQVGEPDSILGYGVTINNDMPVMAANAKSILFGDFYAGYIIRDVLGFQLMRLEERYADYLQVGFLGFARADAKPQDLLAYKAYRNSAT
jgi:HK97 family phage major capsid protein